MCSHRSNYKAWCKDNTCSYTSSFEILKYDDAYIELLEECPCENSAQLHKKEGEYIRLHIDVCVNVQCLASLSKKDQLLYSIKTTLGPCPSNCCGKNARAGAYLLKNNGNTPGTYSIR
jgi:hypothetical protein